jgi:NADP-dependent 3-hydroxy acid dehydrogenase YdfG
LEFEGTHVRVGVIRVGQVESEFAAAWGQEVLGELLGEWKRLGVLRQFVFLKPEEVADATVFMASQPSDRKIDFLDVRALPPEPAEAAAVSASTTGAEVS